MDRFESLELFDAVIGDADLANLALLLECDECLPTFFDVFIGFGPVHLIEIDAIDTKSLEARVALIDDAVAFKNLVNRLRVRMTRPHFVATIGRRAAPSSFKA